MSSLYFNPDDEFLHNDNTINDETTLYSDVVRGASELSYISSNDNNNTWVEFTGGLWGGKEEVDVVDIDKAIIKSNKRFSETKWLKPTNNSALDEIILMINDKTEDMINDKGEDQTEDIKFEIIKTPSNSANTQIKLTKSKKHEKKETDNTNYSAATFNLTRSKSSDDYLTLPEFKTVLKSKKYQLELRKK